MNDTDAAACGVNCTGSLGKPLVGLAALPDIATRGTGDRIFAFSGAYSAGHSFAGSEHLVGQCASGAFDTVLGVTVPGNGTLASRPSLGGAAPSIQSTINLAAGSHLRGVASQTNGVTGISGGAVNSPTISETTVSATNAAAFLLNGTTGVNLSFPVLSSSGSGTSGVSLTGVTGNFTATGGG